MKEFVLPKAVSFVLERLNGRGYEAYVVGGCVRDHLMGRVPSDYDVTTNAKPKEMQEVFSDCRVVETGLKHGTLTVVLDGMNIEVTTYRVDGAYDDGRHPNEVTFTASLEEDLCRRDFTVNAIAYSPRDGFADPFDGIGDIGRCRIACVGDPVKRFSEDALRILRAIRFSATLGFAIDPLTAGAVKEMHGSLSVISRERIYQELSKMVCGQSVQQVMGKFFTVIAYAMDPTGVHITPRDIYDAARHMEQSPCYPEMRFAVILCHASYKFHELMRTYRFDGTEFAYIGKGEYLFENGGCPDSHRYYKEENVSCSMALAKHVYGSLKPSRKSMQEILALLENRFSDTSDGYTVKKLMGQYGEAFPEQLIWFRMTMRLISADRCSRDVEQYRRVRDSNPCVTVGGLAVNGKDAAAVGYRGAGIGSVLLMLLDGVMRGELANDRETLLEKMKKQQEFSTGGCG